MTFVRLLLAVAVLAVLAVSCTGTGGSASSTTSQPTTTLAPVKTTEATPTTTTTEPGPTTMATRPIDVLVFHKTGGFRHGSIPAGIAAMAELAAGADLAVTATDDATVFDSGDLARFGVVVFLNTTGEVLDESQQAAMESYIQYGGAFVGVHAAADTEYDWGWYGGLLGTYFDGHPDPQTAIVTFPNPDGHPITDGAPTEIEWFDEWYDFEGRPGPEVIVLATIDETSYEGGTMGVDHPIAWAHHYDGGRSVYIGFGHTPETFNEPLMRMLLLNSVFWAAGSAP